MDVAFRYAFLRLVLLVVLMVCGYCLRKESRFARVYEFLILTFFTLIEGLRWGRGIDYNGYYFRYQDIINGRAEWGDEDPLMIVFCRFLGEMGISYQGFIIMCSFILIVSGLHLLKNDRRILFLSLPIFATYMIVAENLLRWYLGFSFLMIGISFLIKKRFLHYLFFSIVACGFHLGLLLVVPLFMLLFQLKHVLLKPFYACLVYFVLLQMFQTDFMAELVPYAEMLKGVGRYDYYAQSAEKWLTGSNHVALMVTFQESLRNFFLIVYGYIVLQRRRSHMILYFYNLMLFGLVLYPVMNVIELLERYNQLFIFFQVFIAGYCIYDIVLRIRKKKTVLEYAMFILMLYYCYDHLTINFKAPFDLNSNSFLFIWDSEGRNTQNIDASTFFEKK